MAAPLLALAVPLPGWAQVPDEPPATIEPPPTVEPLGDLQPRGPDAAAFDTIVKSKTWLVVLGKALFWDSSVGGDGQACASCHFNAGADPRLVNQLNPGLRGVPFDDKFGGKQPVSNKTASGQKAAPNIKLKAEDFPFHKLQDPGNRQSPLLYTTDDVASSQGVFQGTFVALNPATRKLGTLHDFCSAGSDGIFDVAIGGVRRQVRKVEPRNTPTMINAAFFDRNFWDGRANNVFNGVDPFGDRNPGASVLRAGGVGGLIPERVALENMSLASQAVGPPGSDFEMACGGRSFAHIGRKLLPRTALAGQKIAPTDGVLGPFVLKGANRGLVYSYRQLVQAAFKDDLWNVPGMFADDGSPDTGGFTQDERNFSLFWGLAIDAYERTLISNQSRFDKGQLTEQEQAGHDLFTGQGKCVNCHTGPLLSAAAMPPREPNQRVERMLMSDGGVAFYDGGFYNIGVTPTHQDVGVGDKDPWGNPLSFTRQHVSGQKVDSFEVDPSKFAEPCPDGDCTADARIAVDGAFKTPSLRNVALTAPYFHNGGYKSLEEVVDFYDRGGNRCGQDGNDTTGSGALGQGPVFQDNCQYSLPAGRGSNQDPDVQVLGLTAQQKAELVAFLKALTDDRVRCHKAPFDHPELVLPNGHKPTAAGNRAADAKLRLKEVGKAGYATAACAPNTGNLFTYNLIGTGKMLQVVP